ncbi:TetR/AcrR family transcriptional regulator [Actinomadura sp. 6N118]|uniref:TetR/AcrR family transcriptional regulator n=1 Tax=Actinomadura sp. 6N118 TaxID=3375151 RepID=UPI003797013C
MDATAALVAQHGLLGVTMSQVAKESGIGRATLYKYFPDVESILLAWHGRQMGMHLDQLAQARDKAGDPAQRLQVVLEVYAHIHQERARSHEHYGPELVALLHRDEPEHSAKAQLQLQSMVRDLITKAAQAGHLRDDIAADELATYCLHALQAAGNSKSKAAVQRLVALTITAMRPASQS